MMEGKSARLDIKDAHAKGGRVCAHHLEFDGGMLAAAMSSMGFTDMLVEWKAIVRDGICTMDPSIASWVRSKMGGEYIPKYIPIKLVDAIKAMAPGHANLVQNIPSVVLPLSGMWSCPPGHLA